MRHENKDQPLTAACHRLLFRLLPVLPRLGACAAGPAVQRGGKPFFGPAPGDAACRDDFGGFAKDFESYAADQFPDREQLIGVYTALELAQGKKFARKAYCLQDSWLLTKPTPTKPADLSALQQALAQAGALDRPLVWCVLPLKNEALYDLEPAYFSDETGETNKQALTAALAQVEGLTVIDAEAPLVTGTLADRER